MKKFVITWPTVGLAAVLCAAFVALAKFAPPNVLAPGGVVAIVAAALLRQMAYQRPDGDSLPPPPPPVAP